MKRLDRKDVLQAADRKDLSAQAKAAEVLYAAEQWLGEHIGHEFYWQPKSWKQGTLRIAVKDPASALQIYAAGEQLLEHLQTRYPDYRFREVRTEMVA